MEPIQCCHTIPRFHLSVDKIYSLSLPNWSVEKISLRDFYSVSDLFHACASIYISGESKAERKVSRIKQVGGKGGGGLSIGCKTSTSKTMIHILFAVDMFVE